MFSARKKPDPPKRRNHDLSQFGLMEIPDDFDPSAGFGNDDDGGDSDLEAELAAIAGGGGVRQPRKPKPKLLPANDLDKMIADSLKDVGSDDDDADLENDEDLIGELQNIAGTSLDEVEENPPTAIAADVPAAETEQQLFLPTTTVDIIGVIKQRIEMYEQAEANAKAAGESAKSRRFGRGLKTLKDLYKQASAGKTVNVDDIPPEVSVKPTTDPQTPASDPNTDTKSSPVSSDSMPVSKPIRTAPSPPQNDDVPQAESSTSESTNPISTPEDKSTAAASPLIEKMRARQREYKAAALQSKRAGDTAMALQFLKVVKQFDAVIKMCEDGKDVDLSDMPPPPEQFKEFIAQMQAAAEDAAPTETPAAQPAMPEPAPVEPTPSSATPTTMLEALQQRLNKYKSVEEAAKAEGNSSKARRFGRIVKQYEDAIKQFKNGRPVAYDELPVPPGFGPLPIEGAAAAAAATPEAPIPSASKPTSPSANSLTTPTGTPSSTATTPTATPTATPTLPHRKPAPAHRQELTTRTSGNQQSNNLAEQQMKVLLDRQQEFKQAALEAKRAGEIEQAKEYLKIYKGFDALLNAASSGLPVDLNTLPLPPSQRENLEESFAIIATEDGANSDEDISDIGVRMEEQLAKQLMMCKNTRDHHRAMGDIAGMNRFENLALTVQKDLDLVRYSKRKKHPLPKFHYEKRSFNIVHCNTDLTDNELEIVVVKGMHYKVANPKDVDTYVKVEFPLLNDETFKAKTNLIKDTDSPDYDEHFKVDIQRGNRQFQRIFKRHGVKFEVYSRGGFLRSDILIGTVNVKLQPLETKCDIHDTFDLMEGRKQVGGKLEVKIRVRNPILTKQIEHVNEKWLVLDS